MLPTLISVGRACEASQSRLAPTGTSEFPLKVDLYLQSAARLWSRIEERQQTFRMSGSKSQAELGLARVKPDNGPKDTLKRPEHIDPEYG